MTPLALTHQNLPGVTMIAVASARSPAPNPDRELRLGHRGDQLARLLRCSSCSLISARSRA